MNQRCPEMSSDKLLTLMSLQVILAIIRLRQVSSEVLIILNTPVSVSASSAAAKDIGAGARSEHLTAPSLLRRVLGTFKIKDYSLFG